MGLGTVLLTSPKQARKADNVRNQPGKRGAPISPYPLQLQRGRDCTSGTEDAGTK